MINKVEGFLLRATIFRFMYLFGLSFIIPYVFTKDAPKEVWIFSFPPIMLLFIAIALIGISVFGILWTSGFDLKATLGSLGLITLIPGIFSLILALYGKEQLFGFFSNNFEFSNHVQPVLSVYIDNIVPKIFILTLSYLILGILFLYISMKK